MEIEAKSIDVAFDKGTLDAMIHGSPWSPPEEVLENTGKYMNEVRGYLALDFGRSSRLAGIELFFFKFWEGFLPLLKRFLQNHSKRRLDCIFPCTNSC